MLPYSITNYITNSQAFFFFLRPHQSIIYGCCARLQITEKLARKTMANTLKRCFTAKTTAATNSKAFKILSKIKWKLLRDKLKARAFFFNHL